MVFPPKHAHRGQTAAVGLLLVTLSLIVHLASARPSEAPDYKGRIPSAAASSTAPRPSALFVGDGFAAGVGARGGKTGYPCLTARQMNWYCNLDAEAGTGYLADGAANSPDFRSFVDRLEPDRERYLADVVVVDGGREDSGRPVDMVADAAANYFQALHDLWPAAVIVAVVPFRMGVTPEEYPFGEALAARLRAILRPYNGIVIDPLAEQWVSPERAPSLLYSDGVHPNEAGHSYLAMRLSAALGAAGLGGLVVTDRP